MGSGEEKSLSISAEISLPGGKSSWIGGSFGVSYTKSSSTERGCYADPGDQVCQWTKTAHTAYKALMRKTQVCGAINSKSKGEPYTIRSPNKNYDVKWYCVVNTCRGDGDQYWEEGRAGGPLF